MKKLIKCILVLLISSGSFACSNEPDYNEEDDFKITDVNVTYNNELKITVWEIKVEGKAGGTTPPPAGQLNGAPVLGYVFPTTLKPSDVGFGDTEGIVALALTSHPDFDDTPLWDENNDRKYDNDGIIWHSHWVILHDDSRVEGGLSVKEIPMGDTSVILPPTNPGMPMYMDSPGFQVITQNNSISVMVPGYRMNHQTDFKYDGVTAFMQVNTEMNGKPMLGVYEVYSVASGDLSLPYSVKTN